MKRILVAAGVVATLLLFHGVRADTVILADGSRMEGRVRVAGGEVTIVTREATLTLPAGRVIGVETGSPAPTPAAPQVQQPAAAPLPTAALLPAAAPRPAAPAAAPVAGPPPLPQALAMKTDVNFDGTSPDEAFGYLRTITGMNLVLSNDVRRDATPVYMHLHDVTVGTVLNLLGDMNGYTYEMKPGEVLFATMRTSGSAYVLRVYPVRDLLLSTEDTGSNVNGTNGGLNTGVGTTSSGSSGGRSQGLSPQFSATGGGMATITRGGVAMMTGAGAATNNQGATPNVLFYRAQDLATLITQTCGDGTWAHAPDSGPMSGAGLPRSSSAQAVA